MYILIYPRVTIVLGKKSGMSVMKINSDKTQANIKQLDVTVFIFI